MRGGSGGGGVGTGYACGRGSGERKDPSSSVNTGSLSCHGAPQTRFSCRNSEGPPGYSTDWVEGGWGVGAEGALRIAGIIELEVRGG